MPYRVSKNCSKFLDMTQTCPTKMFQIPRIHPSSPKKIAQNCSKFLKVAQNCSEFLRMLPNASKCFKMGQQLSKGVMCLHTQVRKLSLLGIAVAGVYCWMGLRSVSIAPRSSLRLRSDPSIVNFNWQGWLVITLAAIVSVNGLSQNHHCLGRRNRSCPQFLLFHYCLLVIPQSDMNFCFFVVFWFERYQI